MTFCVGFVNDVEAQFITEVQETRIIGVMRTTHRIDVVLLHQNKISTHVVNIDGLAFIGMMIVPIDATNHDSLTIYQK